MPFHLRKESQQIPEWFVYSDMRRWMRMVKNVPSLKKTVIMEIFCALDLGQTADSFGCAYERVGGGIHVPFMNYHNSGSYRTHGKDHPVPQTWRRRAITRGQKQAQAPSSARSLKHFGLGAESAGFSGGRCQSGTTRSASANRVVHRYLSCRTVEIRFEGVVSSWLIHPPTRWLAELFVSALLHLSA